MDRLGVTRGTALSLIGELVDTGCLSNLTARSTSRVWALLSLAARMGHALGLRAGLSPRLSASMIFQWGTLAGGTIRPGLSAEPILSRVVRLYIKGAEWPRDRRGPASA